MYFSGDGAVKDEDGYIQITGRMDDVINISGHRLGTAEIEDMLVRSRYLSQVISSCSRIRTNLSRRRPS